MKLGFKQGRDGCGNIWVVPIVAETGEEIEGVTACCVESNIMDVTRMTIDLYAYDDHGEIRCVEDADNGQKQAPEDNPCM